MKTNINLPWTLRRICVPQKKNSPHSYCVEFRCSFHSDWICFLRWVLVAEVCYSPVAPKWKAFMPEFVAKSYIKYGQLLSLNMKKNGKPVFCSIMKLLCLQTTWSINCSTVRKLDFKKYIYFLKTPDNYL